MGLFFAFDKHHLAKFSNDLPAVLPSGYILKGATAHCYRNGKDVLLSQTVRNSYGTIQLYFIELNHKQSVYVQEREPMLGFWHVLQGNAAWMLQSNGKTQFQEGQSKLVYSPGNLLHHSMLDKGVYAILGFSVAPDWLKPMAGKMQQIAYLLQQAEQEGAFLVQQLPLKLNGNCNSIYEGLLQADYTGIAPDNRIQQSLQELLNMYFLLLRKEQKRLLINDGDVKKGILIKNYIDSNLSGDVSLKLLEKYFNKKATTLQKALKSILGQTIAIYTLEQRLGLAFQEILNTCDSLAVIAKRCGISDKNLLDNFLPRYGFNTRWLRYGKSFQFPDHD